MSRLRSAGLSCGREKKARRFGKDGVNVTLLIHALRTQAKRGKLTIALRERGAIAWADDVAAP